MKNKFKVGKWYKRTDDDLKANYICYIKCSNNDPFSDNEQITVSGKYTKKHESGRNEYNWELLTDLSEIQPFLPDGHVDKYFPYKHLPFPIDRKYFTARVVRDIIRDEISTKGCLPPIIPAGSIIWFNDSDCKKPIQKQQGDVYVCPENNRYSANIPASYFEFIEEVNSATKYPEYYKCILAEESGGGFTLGKIYKIINPENLEGVSNFIDDRGDKNGWGGFNYRHFTPSTKEEYDKQKWTPTVGDWAYVLRTGPDDHRESNRIDVCFEIKEIVNNTWLRPTKGLTTGIHKEYCRQALPHEMPFKTTYHVGDWVLLSKDANGWGSHSRNVNNKILQITKIDLGDNTDNGGRIYFGKERTVGKEIVRKALPYEIPQIPENWCIQVTESNKPDELYEWRDKKYYAGGGYIHSDRFWGSTIKDGYRLITLDEFRKHVLKWDTVVPNVCLGVLPGEITIPSLIKKEIKSEELITISTFPDIKVNFTPKIVPKLEKIILKPTKIQTK